MNSIRAQPVLLIYIRGEQGEGNKEESWEEDKKQNAYHISQAEFGLPPSMTSGATIYLCN